MSYFSTHLTLNSSRHIIYQNTLWRGNPPRNFKLFCILLLEKFIKFMRTNVFIFYFVYFAFKDMAKESLTFIQTRRVHYF